MQFMKTPIINKCRSNTKPGIASCTNDRNDHTSTNINDLINIHKAYMREIAIVTKNIKNENKRKFKECSEIVSETKKENKNNIYNVIKIMHENQLNSIQKIKKIILENSSKEDVDNVDENVDDKTKDDVDDTNTIDTEFVNL